MTARTRDAFLLFAASDVRTIRQVIRHDWPHDHHWYSETGQRLSKSFRTLLHGSMRSAAGDPKSPSVIRRLHYLPKTRQPQRELR
jgi:hypothetical protein